MAGKTIFDSVKMQRPSSSVFDLSHDVKLSCNMGQLVPICILDCVPGDKIKLSCESLLRFQPLVSPVMHRYDVFMHYFFVPYRILWSNWEKWITNTKGVGGLPAHPYITINFNGSNYTSLMDHMGVPDPSTITGANTNLQISPMAFAAYQKVYNEYYRDQNLAPVIIGEQDILTDGDNAANLTALTTMRRRAWEHDYFTSALPFAQKGDSVDIPLGDIRLKDDWETADIINPFFVDSLNQIPIGVNITQNGVLGPHLGPGIDGSGNGQAMAYDPRNTLEAEATTINDLRLAFRLQEWLEKQARGGTRYTESNRVHFGVTSPDSRLQRPEYITGTRSPVSISEVLNSTGTTERPQGDMAGHAVSVTAGNYGSYYCQEHGYIIGIMSVMPRTAYYQGLPKHFTKISDPTELYWPTFANIGEQAILSSELYAYNQPTPGTDEIFGYIPRYAEYKYVPSRVAGDFKTTLDFWQHARRFDSMPLLNQQFIEANPDNRIFAVEDPTVDKLLVHVYNKIQAVRPMPKYGTPQF